MTLSEARAAAAGAIRAAATAAQVRRVLEVDVLHERQIPAIAKGLTPAHTGTRGTSGPADVCVMATGRRASQGIGITAVLIILDRVDLDPGWTGSGRGLAVHDVVAGALEGLPGHGLPRLLVESSMEQLPVAVQEAQAGESSIRSSDPRVALHVFTLHVEWPPAFPVDPLATDVDSSTQAIRQHVGAAITTGLPAGSDAQAGAEEADRREAVIAGTVPRAWIVLRTQRESIGGAPDFVVRAPIFFRDAESPPRTWSAQAVTQTVVVVVHVAHRTEQLADASVISIAGELEGTSVIWPGVFRARVLAGGSLTTQRLTGGDYAQDIRLLMFERAEWDAESGLAVARLQLSVEAVDLIEPATRVVRVGTLEHDAAPVVPIRGRRVAISATVEVRDHGLAGAITATSDDTGIATVSVAGQAVTVAGVARGTVTVVIVETVSGARRALQMRVVR